MVGAAIALAAAVARLPYDARDEATARAWIARAGHRFDPATVSAADLQPIVAALGDARVIGIGEATHGTHQDEAFKAELIKALVRAGRVDLVAIECNRQAGEGFDRYVRLGEGDPAALMRAPSFFSIWRNDAFGGLLLWLRAWNQIAARPVRIVGIDLQDTSTDAARALGFVARHDPAAAHRLTAAFGDLLPGADGVRVFLPDWVGAAPLAKFTPVLAAATELETRMRDAPAGWRADPDFPDAAYAARTARQGLVMFEREYKGAPESAIDRDYISRRDRFMAANLLDRLGDGRAVVWAHDDHLVSAYRPADEKAGKRDLGMELRGALGAGYRTVGFTWSSATLHVVPLAQGAPAPTSDQRRFAAVPLRNDRPGEWGHVLGALPGDGWWIDLAHRPHTPALDRWAARPLWHGWVGWGIDPAHWQDDPAHGSPTPPDRGIDVLVWFRAMGPARVWPEPARLP